MRRTALRGHALQHEGRACEPANDRFGLELTRQSEGVAICECGVASPTLPSTAARQRWHREVHKPEVRARGESRG